jgi:hypothetical protein
MTTQAPLHPLERAATTSAHDQTTPLEAHGEPITDSLPLLDHRTRSRAISTHLAPRGHYLALQDGDETRLVSLETKITHIGRGLGAEVRFEHPNVSRSHAIIVRQGRSGRVLDNRSANGTFLNGRQIVATNLADGDVIRVGSVVMQYLVVS